MIDIQKTAREATLDEMWDLSPRFLGRLEKFAALIREAVVQELVAGSGEPDGYRIGKDGEREDVFTRDQLAGAVLRERERCAQIAEDFPHDQLGCLDEVAAAIRSGE